MPRSRLLPTFAAVLALASIPAIAQDSRGTLLGRVTDTSNAVIPGVGVRATSVSTGVTVSGRTNPVGGFSLPFLAPGTYTVTAEMKGFKRFVREGVQIRVADSVEINIAMELGAVSESIKVTEATPLLETASSSLGQVVDERRILELPLMGGNPVELMFLTPGVLTDRPMTALKAPATGTKISADGNPALTNEFQIDGVSNTFADGSGGARDAFRPPAAAIREFRIQTSSYDASVGHAFGSFVNVSTASGTNTLHGELHYWARNSAFDAPDFFDNKNNTTAPPYKDNRYGLSGGGPVYLPGLYHGRNKTFWYYAWEGNKWDLPKTVTYTVPTEAERRGDLSALLRIPNGSAYQVYDPNTTAPASGGRLSRQPLPNNIIPASRISPVAQKLLALYSLPNQAGTADGRNNFYRSLNGMEDYFVHLVRVDHTFSQNHRAFLRMNYDHWVEDKNDYYSNRSCALILERINRGIAADDVIVLSPTLVANFRYGLTNQEFPERRASRGVDLAGFGFSPALVSLIDKKLATLPRFSAGGFSPMASWDSGDGTNTGLTHSFSATATKLHKAHNLRFGADFRVYRAFGNRYPRAASPDFSFPNTYTKGPLDNSPAAAIGQELAAMLLGIPGGSMERRASSAMQEKYLGLYLQDDFKLSSRLTLNLGLRYELETPVTERYDRLVAGFAFSEANPIEVAARANYARNPIPELAPNLLRVPGGLTFVGQGQKGRSPFRGEKNNFLPRIGLAWQLRPGTTVRTGYGIYYGTLGVNGITAFQDGFSQRTPIQASLDNGLTYVATLANPFPSGLLAPLGPAGGLTTNLGQAVVFYDPDRRQPYSQRWSFGLQQLLPGQFLLDASYVGNRGTRLGADRELNATPARYLSTQRVRDQRTIDYLTAKFPNPFNGIDPIYGTTIGRSGLLVPYPQFGSVSLTEAVGYSWYHSLQVRAEKRMAQGYTFQLAYTWAKAMEATEFLNDTDRMPGEVVGGFDRTHRVAASGIWELPVGRHRRFGAKLPGLLDFFIGGWQLGGVLSKQSGQPLGFGNAIFNGDLKAVPLDKSVRTVDRWFNTEAGFNRSSAQQLSQNIRALPLRFSGIRGDTLSRQDFSVIKNFRVTERADFHFRAEVYNAWNHPSFANPNTTPTNSTFGRTTSTQNDPRGWQFSGRLKF